ncbi:MAG: phosphoenolpyruvate--protein phosphotransferase [Proteobacteria bacterium]|nr:phosphoenolpyruvate--protein phosphotransferase [Pseudomonadota bacterium]
MKGIGVSSGVTIGRAFVIKSVGLDLAHQCYLETTKTDNEVERFERAIQMSADELICVKKKMEADGRGQEHIRIIDAHLLILKDHMITGDTIDMIRAERVNAEWALKKVMDGLLDFFNNMDDEYLKQRSSDIEHLVNMVLVNLTGRKKASLSDLKSPAVIIAHDLSPAETAQMVKGTVLGFLTDAGAKTSHTAIMARALEIPAVVGLETITHKVETGDMVIIDGTTGTVIINPSKSVVNVYKKRKERYENYGRSLFHYKDMPSETTDGERISLLGNMEIVEEIDSLLKNGAEGIGLYRTEFLYLNRKDMPTEDEHTAAYETVIRRMAPRPVVIRTLDVGGDKLLPGMEVSDEINPALGLRAIRFCLKNKDIFKTQLRGILRASAKGPVQILLPMISGVDEIRHARALIEECKTELETEGKKYDRNIEIGAMIEIPSAAVITDLIAKEVDFVSIGTNDLLQYSLAIDRVNEHVAYLYEPFHPAVLRIIKTVAEAANKAGISVGVCGEMAGEPEYAIILLGFGIDKLSMSAYSLLRVKRLVRSVSIAQAKELCEKIMEFATASEVEQFVSNKIPDLYKEEFWS